jgi:hypothetical protein
MRHKMSSVIDAGYAAEKAREVRESFCPESNDGKHEWEKHGSWPSTWGECKKCKAAYFDK